MKNTYLKLGIFCYAFIMSLLPAQAQLADWYQTTGTNFPTNISGQIHGMTRIVQLKHHATDSTKMYAVTAEGGFYVSTNKGDSWSVKSGTENLTGSCASLCIDYTNEQTIWLGTGDPNYYSNGQGILKSTDGGTTFSSTSLTNALVLHIKQNPLNASQLLAATNKGIYKSTNGGVTWSAKTATNLEFVDLVMNPGLNSQTLFACTKSLNPQLFKSVDFGESWVELTNGITYAVSATTGGARIGVTPADTNVVYFEVIGGGGIIHKSVDGGISFVVKKAEGSPYLTFYDVLSSTSSAQGNYNNCIWVDRNNPSKIWLQSHCTMYSNDDGVTWTQLTHWASKVHTDMHQLEQAPFNDNLLISCNDGGVWFSTDGGNNWTPKSNGICAYEIGNNCGVSSKVQKDFVSIGTQDNGRLYGNSTGWFTTKGGDDYAKRVTDYNGHIYYDGVKRQLNHTGAEVTYNLPTTNWNALAFNRTDVNLGFMGVNDVWRCNDLASTSPTWTQISTFNSTIRDLHSCIANPNQLYVLLTNGDVYVSSNALAATPTFTLYAVPGVASSTGSIVAMANNANIVYLVENSSAYRSGDGGVTWTNVKYNLPNVNHRRILAEDYGGTNELVIVGTNNAVYYKKAGQTTWTNYSTNLPGRRAPTEMSMFDNGTNESRIRYATFGRSIWETKFGNLRETSAAFSTNTTYYCTPGTPMTYNDQSNGNIVSWNWSFPGGSPATSNLQNPVVTYANAGLYSATLTVSDGVNSSTITRNNYVLVLQAPPAVNTGCAISSNSNLNNGFGIGISFFGLANINSITSRSNGAYNDYTCNTFTYLTAGNTYNATVSTGTANAEGAALYLDINNNGIFESTELLTTYPANNSGTRTIAITIPTTGVQFNKGLRLRILSRFNAVPTNACNVSTYGQAEDYTVYIQQPASAVLSNGSGPSSICSGSTANLQVTITGGVAPYTVVLHDGTSNQTITNYISGSDIPVNPLNTATYSLVSVTDFATPTINLSGLATVNVTATTANTTNMTACDTYTWNVNNANYTSSGTYMQSTGCHTETLLLTIYASTSNTTNASACGNYLWSADGNTYTASGTYTSVSLNANGCTHTEVLNLIIQPCNATLQVTVYLQGYYLSGGTMEPVLLNQGLTNPSNDCDDVTIELHDALPPYATQYSFTGVLQTNGFISCTYPPAAIGGNYYIVVNQRNHVQTWSAVPVTINSITNYNFSSAATQAYGNNLAEVETGVFACLVGDINQDLVVDGFDFISLDADIVGGNSGYLSTDLDGNGVVDAFDYLMLDPNITLGITIQMP